MAPVQKIKVIIEVALTEHDHLVPGSLHSPKDSEASHEDMVHQQVLFTALRENPESYAEFIRTIIVGSLETLEVNRTIASLAQLASPYTASLAILEKLFPQLPLPTQQHFQQAIQQGWLSEGTMDIFDAIEATPISLTVDYGVNQP